LSQTIKKKEGETRNDNQLVLLQKSDENHLGNINGEVQEIIKEIHASMARVRDLLDSAENKRENSDAMKAQKIINVLRVRVRQLPCGDERDFLTKEITELFARANISLVYFVVNQYIGTRIPYDELVGLAMFGYAKAIDSYNPERNVKFTTYAVKCMTNEILFFLRKENRHKVVTSFNTPLSTDGEGNSLLLGDLIDEDYVDEKSLEEKIIDKEREDYIRSKIKDLTEEEKYIIMHRYGIDGAKFKTQREIAKDIGMSQANVSKLERNILDKMKSSMEDDNYQYNLYIARYNQNTYH